jgi:competence protein ComEC
MLLLPLLTFSIYFMGGIVPERGLSVTFLDVGQGDSSVIELPDGKTVVVDTGSTGFETSSYLKYRGITDIDALVLSHVHPDHSGGLKSLTERFRVHEIWDNGKTVFPGYAYRIPRRSLSRGDVLEGKGYHILVLHPYKEFYTMYGKAYQEENNDSLVFRLQGDSASFLFTGDIEQEAADDILHLGGWLRSDVMKVPHHGSRTSAHERLVTVASPGIAVISVALHNSFGHPHHETLHILQNARIMRTDSEGSIKVQETRGVLKVKKFKDFELQKTLHFPDEVKNLQKLFQTW